MYLKKLCRFLFVLCFLFILTILNSCSPPTSPETGYGSAIVFVVDDSDFGIDSTIIGVMEHNPSIKSYISLIACGILEVPQANIATMELPEMLLYGLNKMVDSAQNHYDKVVLLQGETLNKELLLDSVRTLATNGFTIDLMFFLHGSNNSVVLGFNDGFYSMSIGDITETIRTENIPVRMLYQTCCYGASTIDEWEKTGIGAVNGARALNVPFSASYIFFSDWIGGAPYTECVENAFARDSILFTSLASLSNNPQIETLVENWIEGSQQTIGGNFPGISIKTENYN